MGPAFYVMAILGCADNTAACQQVSVAETRYESADACNAATTAVLMDNSDVAYPVIVAQCQRADAALVSAQSARPHG